VAAAAGAACDPFAGFFASEAVAAGVLAEADAAGASAVAGIAALGMAGGSPLAIGDADDVGAGGAAAVADGSGFAGGIGAAVATDGRTVDSGACCGSGGDQFALWHPVARIHVKTVRVLELKIIVVVVVVRVPPAE
jgi:hypothetical protein